MLVVNEGIAELICFRRKSKNEKIDVASFGTARNKVGRSVKNLMIQDIYGRKWYSIGIRGSPSDTARGVVAQLS